MELRKVFKRVALSVSQFFLSGVFASPISEPVKTIKAGTREHFT